MNTLEQEILSEISKLDEQRQRRVLDFIRSLETPTYPTKRRYSARDLLQLPLEERERLVAESFAAAADENFEVFEANTEDDFDDYV